MMRPAPVRLSHIFRASVVAWPVIALVPRMGPPRSRFREPSGVSLGMQDGLRADRYET